MQALKKQLFDMQKKQLSPFLIYTLLTVFIIGWWFLAFKQSESSFIHTKTEYSAKQIRDFQADLTPLNRDLLKKALVGDYTLMAKLMADWDIDAQILEQHGINGVHRLSRESYVKAQLLERQLKQSDLEKRESKFLPQTYISATLLLTLSDPNEIIGIPQGIRDGLFPKQLTDQVPMNIDRFNSEKIFHSKPDVAFIANYSQPSTVQALRNQGIKLFSIEAVNTLPEITEAILSVGEVVNRKKEATLLALFMESAMMAIDNHLILEKSDHPTRVMFLNHHAHYTIPTEKTITGHLLKRLQAHGFTFLSPPVENQNSWRVVVDQEKIINYHPDCLIVACSDGEALETQILKYSPLTRLPALQNGNLFFVDDDIQQSPTQFIVLAYYDLAQALGKVKH